jgi:hypothetical protein
MAKKANKMLVARGLALERARAKACGSADDISIFLKLAAFRILGSHDNGTSWRAHHPVQRVGFLCREVKGRESLGVGIG